MSELYKEAAALLDQLECRRGGLKSLAYADSVQHKQSSFALVCETLRFRPLLLDILAAVPAAATLLRKATARGGTQRALLLVALYDLLFGRHKIQGGGTVKKQLAPLASALREALVRMKIRARVATDEALLPPENRRMGASLPRYVRVNTLKISADELDAFVAATSAARDEHVRDLLVLPAGTDLHAHALVLSGKLVLQDKASCFPAFILQGEHEDAADRVGDVIDACAAPGNKTSHLAMLLHQQHMKQQLEQEMEMTRRVMAFDRSPTRLELLKRRMQLAGADGIVDACLQSFLEVDPMDTKYANVRSILLDPSCSGSGMNNRLDHLLDAMKENQNEESRRDAQEQEQDALEDDNKQTLPARLQSLEAFQLEALCKAFSFPQVERVTYSTCSVYNEENEQVVAKALAAEPNASAARPFVLRPCLQTWPRRGREVAGLDAEQASALVRADPLEDSTNGFFVAYFERVEGEAAHIQPTARTEQHNDEEDDQQRDVDDASAGQTDTTESKKRPAVSDSQRAARKRRKQEKRKKRKERRAVSSEEPSGATSG